jgi:hypothetical protein
VHKKPIDTKKFESVPEFIYQIYEEVIKSYNSESVLLPAAGLRTIVEAICNDVKVVNGVIYDENDQMKTDKQNNPIRNNKIVGKINGLQEKAIITTSQRKVLHQVRELGNYAVHEIHFPKRRTVKLGIEIIENILENIYELGKYSIAPKKKSVPTVN